MVGTKEIGVVFGHFFLVSPRSVGFLERLMTSKQVPIFL